MNRFILIALLLATGHEVSAQRLVYVPELKTQEVDAPSPFQVVTVVDKKAGRLYVVNFENEYGWITADRVQSLDVARRKLEVQLGATKKGERRRVNILLGLGRVQMRQGSTEEAIATLKTVTTEFPTNSVGFTVLAFEYALLGEYQKVVDVCTDGLSTCGKEGSLYLNRGVGLSELGKKEEALADYERSIALDGNLLAVDNKAQVLRALGRTAEALEVLNKVIRKQKRDFLFHQRALVHMDRMELEEARVDFQRALGENPEKNRDAGFRYDRAGLHTRLVEYDLALHEVDAAIGIRPRFASAHAARSFILTELGRPKEGLAAADLSLKLRDDLPTTYANKGLALDRLGRHKEAAVSMTKAIEMAPNNLHYLRMRGIIYATGNDDEKAITDLTECIRREPAAHTFLTRGRIFARQQKVAKALADFHKAVQLSPSNVQARHHRGRLYASEKEYQKAIVDFMFAMKEAPRSISSGIELVQVYNRQKQFPQALIVATQLVQRAPNAAASYGLRSEVLLNMKDLSRAHRDAVKAVELAPLDMNANRCLADACYFQQKWNSAAVNYSVLLGSGRTDLVNYYRRGVCYLNLNMPEKAVSDFSAGVKQSADDAEMLRARARALVALNRYDEALADINLALRHDPTSGIALADRGRIHFKQARDQEAMADFRSATRQKSLTNLSLPARIEMSLLIAASPDDSVRNIQVTRTMLATEKDNKDLARILPLVNACVLASDNKFGEALEIAKDLQKNSITETGKPVAVFADAIRHFQDGKPWRLTKRFRDLR